jgi:hypothetical protein
MKPFALRVLKIHLLTFKGGGFIVQHGQTISR